MYGYFNLNIQDPFLRGLVKKSGQPINLHYFDSAPNDNNKPVLVFIHGNSSSHRTFAELIAHFSSDCRVIAIDLIGHGESTKIDELPNLTDEERNTLAAAFYSPFGMVNGLVELLNHCKVEEAHFIGWSLGGHLGYGIAHQAPGLVKSLVTIGSPPVMFAEQGFLEGFTDWFVKTLLPEWRDNPQHFSKEIAVDIAKSFGFTPGTQLSGQCIQDLMNTDPLIRKYLFIDMMKFNSPEYQNTILDGKNLVENASFPICLMVGGNDAGINAGYIRDFKFSETNKHPLSTVVVMDDATHAPFATHREAVQAMVGTFFDKVAHSQDARLSQGKK